MGVLEDLEPKKVFYYFEELTKIPHGSYNVDKISDYLADFGKNHGLQTIQDEYKNVIIIKEATEGYEDLPPLILQGHMDMVAVHTPELDIDMKKEPLKVAVSENGDYIYAKGTSLGGDDGVAVAYCLALLDDESLKHPRLEVVFTTNEETGMEGANGIDLSMLKGNRLLNLDSEDEGIFLTSCAGGLRANVYFPMNGVSCEDIKKEYGEESFVCDVEIGGLLGGHSGEEIIKGRANSNKLSARLMYEYASGSYKKAEQDRVAGKAGGKVYITYIDGGLADNAIPRVTKFGLVVSDVKSFEEKVKSFNKDIKDEYGSVDPDIYCRILSSKPLCDNGSASGADSFAFDAGEAVKFLFTVPNGVQAMSADVEGLVQTSLNLGIVRSEEITGDNPLSGADLTGGSLLHATFSVRSSIESAKDELTARVCCLAESFGGRAVLSGNYPGWAYRADSPLRDKMTALYKKMYGSEPVLKAIHAGLECGILGSKIKDLDCVSIGPDMKDIHTTEEKLYIESSRRVYEFVRALIEEK
ncbi:MAG: aminoacyl-histidine dipeptidase [Lachnospiraceae bacterium]|nr:aminoacyl-histidine dipeptidase [Lachnospiraceae bacterium]